MLRFTITAGAAALAIAAGTAAAAAPAMAAGAAPVQAVTMAAPQFVTHVNGHADTTSLINPVPASQQAVTNTPYGPVWAYDTETVKLTPVQVTPSVANGHANWQVTVDVTGSFAGFADPNTGAALTSSGSVKGTITYDVQADQPPSGANLPSQEQSGIGAPGLHDYVVQLFGGPSHASIVGGGDVYTFSYQNGNYTQIATPTLTVSGDVIGS